MSTLLNPAEENYYALALCILTDRTPEEALNYFSGPVVRDINKHRKLTDQDIEDMINLKQTLTYEQVGEIYNMGKHAVRRRIQRYLKRKGACSWANQDTT